MRGTLNLLFLSSAVLAVAFITRRIFFWDVMPVSWDREPPQSGALEIAFLLLSIQNIAAIVAAMTFVLSCVLIIDGLAKLSRPASQV